MKASTVDFKDIKSIVDLMKKNAISEFELEKEDFKIKLRRSPNGSSPYTEEIQVQKYLPPAASSSEVIPPKPASTAPPELESNEVKSPMIGTFYRAPSPEAASFIEVGDPVEPDTVICIIEAMKVMNEIKAEMKGVVTAVLVENARPVEFGQPILRIRPA